MHCSPMPMQTTSGLVSDTATAPTEELWICPSVTGAPVSAAVGRFPEAAAGLSGVGLLRPALDAARGNRTSGASGTDAAPLIAFQQRRIDRACSPPASARSGDGAEVERQSAGERERGDGKGEREARVHGRILQYAVGPLGVAARMIAVQVVRHPRSVAPPGQLGGDDSARTIRGRSPKTRRPALRAMSKECDFPMRRPGRARSSMASPRPARSARRP